MTTFMLPSLVCRYSLQALHSRPHQHCICTAVDVTYRTHLHVNSVFLTKLFTVIAFNTLRRIFVEW